MAKHSTPGTPAQSVLFCGSHFRPITRSEAHARIGALKDPLGKAIYDVLGASWRFPDEEGAVFLLAENDVQVDQLELAYDTPEHPGLFILGIICMGNLHVARSIFAFDTDNSPALIVLGEARARLIDLYGNVHTLGSVACEVLLGRYNHGELFVLGETRARLVVADDMPMHLGRLAQADAVISLTSLDLSRQAGPRQDAGPAERGESFLPPTHHLADVARQGLFSINESGDERLSGGWGAPTVRGLALQDDTLCAVPAYPDFAKHLQRAMETLTDRLRAAGGGLLHAEDGPRVHSFQLVDDAGNISAATGFSQRQIFCWWGARRVMVRAVQTMATGKITLALEQLTQENGELYSWYGALHDDSLEMRAVKRGVLDAIAKL